MEIERKWLLKSLPKMRSLPVITNWQVFQAYLPLKDYRGEVRIRSSTDQKNEQIKYNLTFKSDGTLARQEFELEIPQWVFCSLKLIAKNPIRKKITLAGNHYFQVEFHIYSGSLKGLIIMEYEFASEEEAKKFSPPDGLDIVSEVTDDLRYKNKNLAVNGLPK